MKKYLLTLAALCGFFISQNVWATCSNAISFTDGSVLTAAQLNSVQSNYTNCVNDVLNGDTFTGTLNLVGGADLNIYSDNPAVTLKFAVDGATGDVGIPEGRKLYLDGTNLAGDTYISSNAANSIYFVTGGSSNLFTDTTGAGIIAGKKFYIDSGFDTYITEFNPNEMRFYTNAQLNLSLASNSVFIPATNKLYMDGGGDTYMYESAADTWDFWVGGGHYLRLTTGGIFAVNHGTTGAAANAYINAADGNLLRSTSSQRYKTNIQNLEIDSSKIYELRPVSYDDKTESERDGEEINGKTFHKRRYFGLISEEVNPIIPELVDKNSENGQVEGVYYERLTVLLLAQLKTQKQRIDTLEARLQAANIQ